MAGSSMDSPVPQGSYYEVLGVQSTASPEKLRQAYKDLAVKHHPDKNPDRTQQATSTFQVIAEAYSVLRDEGRRRAYDLSAASASGVRRIIPQSTVSINAAKDLLIYC